MRQDRFFPIEIISDSWTNNNSFPVALNDTYSTNEDTPLIVPAPGVLLNDSDANGQPLSVSQVNDLAANVNSPVTLTNGTITMRSNGSFAFTPALHSTGGDSFTYQVSDGNGGTANGSVTITVTQVNDAGTFGGDLAATTDEEAPTSGTATFADAADGFTAPNFVLSGAATNGTATIDAAGNWTYTRRGLPRYGQLHGFGHRRRRQRRDAGHFDHRDPGE